ncbi:hypothetical protein CM19_04665 [Candidatus Acidianus copahuensis]|uniref:Uncharacterized protein n=1 Tax=Candidatus Acidianus copahuensis TaxID=1160895 RepID=A0A031LNS8_9CREN|nr:hypothetical protein [Candidatus Acidianus copahuensis]EZQ10032.1 hypothetical protein CM19_04665 [Candidatus Acidianus copahuensis]
MANKIFKVLFPWDLGIEDTKIGVGSPCLVYDPRRDSVWMLFTGWKDPVGLKREVYIVKVDNSFNLEKNTLRKIISFDFPEVREYSHNTVRCIYNEVRDEFLVTTSHGEKIYLFVYDGNWNIKWYKEIWRYSKAKDAGFPLKPAGAYWNLKDAYAVAPIQEPEEEGIEFFLVKNIHSKDVKVENMGIIGRWGRANDVLDFVTIPRFQVFIEENTKLKWLPHTFIGPTLDELRSINDFKSIFILEGSLTPLLPFDESFVQIGHPFYTTLPDGRPKLLLASFRDTWTIKDSSDEKEGREGYSHEIWGIEVDSTIFNSDSYGELRGRINEDSSGRWIYCPNRRKIAISSSKDLKIEMKVSLSDNVAEEIKANAGINVIDSPLTWVRISGEGNISATVVATK